MFFKTTDFAISNISVFPASWKKLVGDSQVRPFHALSLRIEGNAEFTFEKGSVSVESNNILFVPAYCNFHLNAAAEKLIVIHFNTDQPIADSIQKLPPSNPSIYRQYFEEILDVYSKREVGYEYACKGLLYKIIASIERDCSRKKETVSNEKIQSAIRYIHRNFTEEKFSVRELSEMCSMSETYFRKLFARTYGCSPLVYINNLRAERAIEMLKTKYYTVSEVSEKCGFSTPYYFSNFIKNRTGQSPSKFIK